MLQGELIGMRRETLPQKPSNERLEASAMSQGNRKLGVGRK